MLLQPHLDFEFMPKAGRVSRKHFRRDLHLRPKPDVRNTLFELRPWMFDVMLGNFDGPCSPILAYPEAPRFRNSILERLTALHDSRESSAAHLGPFFCQVCQKCKGFWIIFATSTLRTHHLRVPVSNTIIS